MSEIQNAPSDIPTDTIPSSQEPAPPQSRTHTSCTIDADIIVLMDKRCNAARDDPDFECSHSSIINKALRQYFNLPVSDTEDRWASRRIAVSRANRKPRPNANA